MRRTRKMLVWQVWKIDRKIKKTVNKPVWKRVHETDYGRFIDVKSDDEIDDEQYNLIIEITLKEVYQSEPVEWNELASKITKDVFKNRKSVLVEPTDHGIEIVVVSAIINVKK